ncbi:hypothetical protein HKX48_002079 [Thoreauomyces humboldtii]|nr:hypothetical protein HKX48_002079 [Thoreauomyces humboldtii]
MVDQTLPKTYRAIEVQKKGGDFVMTTRDLKMPGKGEVLVRVEACGICHSDSIAKDGHFPGIPYPIVPGHEIVGRIVAVGEGEDKWKVGDRAGGGWEGGHCNECHSCRKGAPVSCVKGTVNGIFRDGGYAEYALLRREAVAAIPEGPDGAEIAPLLCAGVTTFASLRSSNAKAGEVVAVSGIGGLGHLGLQFSAKMGFKTAALSTSDDKKELATKLGATEYSGSKDPQDHVKFLNKLGGAKVILATAPHADSIGPLTDGLALDGELLVVAAAGPVTVNTNTMIAKRTSLRAWASGGAIDSEECIQFAVQTGIKCHIERFSPEDITKGYTKMLENKTRFRGVLVWDQKK